MSSANSEELRRKFTIVQQQKSAPPMLPVPKAAVAAMATPTLTTSLGAYDQHPLHLTCMTTSTPMSTKLKEPERTYVFPATNMTGGGGTGSIGIGSTTSSGILGVPVTTIIAGRGHARSVSHGGGGIVGPSGRPIKSAMKGHQRAFSQGQITDSPSATHATSRGHSRVGSKTDFILPPGHKEDGESRDFGPSVPSSAGGRGHSRQASRSESIYTLRRSETPPWWKRIGVCNAEKVEERTYRIVVPNHTVPPKTPKRDHPNGIFVANKIRTTKYTLLSFIPKNLLEQFHRVANLYFIFIVLLNWFPAINAFGKEVAMIPVLFVLGVTAVKDLFEDRRRRSSDKRINNTTCRVYNG